MSYCVNCGVRLDETLLKCPLCDTVVINPALLNMVGGKDDPFPQESGQVERVDKSDLGLLSSIVLGGISLAVLVLNLFVFTAMWWSLLVIGVCVILFFLTLPAFILTKTPIYLTLLFDAGAVALYLYFISLVTATSAWFLGLAIPVLLLVTAIIIVIVWLIRTFKSTMLLNALYVFTGLAAFCVGLELLIDRYAGNGLSLLWSAVVLTACAVIDIGLLTVLSRRRLREAVNKRLHF
jgi:hypothetical protein